MTCLCVKQNWDQTHNFKKYLIAENGGKKLQKHLLTASENTIYISPPSVANYIDIINNYIKVPLFASISMGKYTLYNGKTQHFINSANCNLCYL